MVAVAYGATRTTRGEPPASGACGALMSNPKAVKAMQALRAEHQKEMQAWIDKYGADPTSAEAQAALKALRDEHWNDMRALFKKFGIKVPAGAGPGGMMRGSGGCGGALWRRRERPARRPGHRLRQRHDGSGGGMMGGLTELSSDAGPRDAVRVADALHEPGVRTVGAVALSRASAPAVSSVRTETMDSRFGHLIARRVLAGRARPSHDWLPSVNQSLRMRIGRRAGLTLKTGEGGGPDRAASASSLGARAAAREAPGGACVG